MNLAHLVEHVILNCLFNKAHLMFFKTKIAISYNAKKRFHTFPMKEFKIKDLKSKPLACYFEIRKSCKRLPIDFERSVRTAAHTLILSRVSFFFRSLLRGSVGHYIPYESHIDI